MATWKFSIELELDASDEEMAREAMEEALHEALADGDILEFGKLEKMQEE